MCNSFEHLAKSPKNMFGDFLENTDSSSDYLAVPFIEAMKDSKYDYAL